MVALTGQARDRETLRGAQRAARTQPEPPRWAHCPWDPWTDLSRPQAQRGLPLHPGADLSRPQAQRGLPLHPWEGLSRPHAHSGAASSPMGRSQWTPSPERAASSPRGRSQWTPGPERAASSPMGRTQQTPGPERAASSPMEVWVRFTLHPAHFRVQSTNPLETQCPHLRDIWSLQGWPQTHSRVGRILRVCVSL